MLLSNQNCNKKVEVCQRCRQNRTVTRRLRCAKESARKNRTVTRRLRCAKDAVRTEL